MRNRLQLVTIHIGKRHISQSTMLDSNQHSWFKFDSLKTRKWCHECQVS